MCKHNCHKNCFCLDFVRVMANTGEKIDLQFVFGTDNISKNITNKIKSKFSTDW